ncbi:P-loop containing nucleoside triphosphate hydrolase protein [Scheffersomyces xylosifermentans]|uniref:P-loop containing nucleoside triphosphate hydrolase protein n=1 Tax=Scheffersomyces xylosifermentans TaxID=1304137 RepID=UPI00315D3976
MHDSKKPNGLQRGFRERLSLPLAEAIRPTTLKEYIGQRHLVDPRNGAITNFMRLEYLPSMLLFGPPGVGKTTIASIIAKESGYVFVELSATDATIADLRDLSSTITEENRKRVNNGEEELNVVVFIDEIHRFTTKQQDFLLPYVEDGNFVFIGATTVNPNKRIRRAILSRCQLFALQSLSHEEVQEVLKRAVLFENIRRRSVHRLRYLEYDEKCLSFVIKKAGGDARSAINLIELISTTYSSEELRYTKGNHVPYHLEFSLIREAISNMKMGQTGLQDNRNLPLVLNLFDAMRHNNQEVDAYESDSSEIGLFKESFKRMVFQDDDPKKEFLQQMQVSDDSDVEDGELYSDAEDEVKLVDPSTASPEAFYRLLAVFYTELLLKRGESPEFINKQLVLFSILYLQSDLTTLRTAMSFMKSIKYASTNIHMALANCVEWLTRHPKLNLDVSNDLARQVRVLKTFFENKKDLVHYKHDIFSDIEAMENRIEVSFDEELISVLMQDEEMAEDSTIQNTRFEVTSLDDLVETDDYSIGEYFIPLDV